MDCYVEGRMSSKRNPPLALTSQVELSAEERAASGVLEGLIRYSMGIENL